MPDWTTYYGTFDEGYMWGKIPYGAFQQLWEEHQENMNEEMKQAEEDAKDRRNYPLFFLKDGIV